MLHLQPGDDYSDIIVRAGLYSEISIDLCAGAIAILLKENGCKLHMPLGSLKSALIDCMELFQQVSGPERLDGELMSRFLLNLNAYLGSLKRVGKLKENINWTALSGVDNNNKRFITDLTISRLMKYFDLQKDGDQIMIKSETIYHLLLPVILITAKSVEDVSVHNKDLLQSKFYKIAVMPGSQVLWMLERICLGAIQGKLFHKKIELERMFEKYFFQTFITELPTLAFYPQLRSVSDEYTNFNLSRDDIKKLSQDKLLKKRHEKLVNLTSKIRKLKVNIARKGLALRLICKLSMFNIDELVLVQIVDEIKRDGMLVAEYQNRFVSLFKEFDKLFTTKANALCALKKEQYQNYIMVKFLDDLADFMSADCWNFPETVKGNSLFVKTMMLNYKAILALALDKPERYRRARDVARQALVHGEFPESDDIDVTVFDLHAAICFASVDWLKSIYKAECDIANFVAILLDNARWRFRPGTNELVAIDKVISLYRELLAESQPPGVLFRELVLVAKKEYEAMKSLSMMSKDIRCLHHAIIKCDQKLLLGLIEFSESVDNFVSGLMDFLNHPNWDSLDSADVAERAIKSALVRYQAVFERGLPLEYVYNELTIIAEREVSVVANARKKLNALFGVVAGDDLMALHRTIFDRDLEGLNSVGIIWSNNINYRKILEETKSDMSSSPISIKY